MSSQARDHKLARSSSDLVVYTTRTWTHLWAHLDSAASGDNSISYEGEFAAAEPGMTISHLVAPGTEIRMKTTSTDEVTWSVLITELDVADQLLGAVFEIRDLVVAAICELSRQPEPIDPPAPIDPIFQAENLVE
jgi:hypothetical protein